MSHKRLNVTEFHDSIYLKFAQDNLSRKVSPLNRRFKLHWKKNSNRSETQFTISYQTTIIDKNLVEATDSYQKTRESRFYHRVSGMLLLLEQFTVEDT